MQDHIEEAPALTVSITVPVEGMTCASCVARIERNLGRQNGVQEARVNLATAEATIAFDPQRLDRSKVIQTIEKTGFIVPNSPIGEENPSVHNAFFHDETGDYRKRFWIALVFTLPVFVISMAHGALDFEGVAYVLWALTTPVVFWSGAPFFKGAWQVGRHGGADMNTLVVLGVVAAYGFSLATLLMPHAFQVAGLHHAPVYFEAATVIITLLLLGRWFEARAKHRTTEAIRSLMNLQPQTTWVIRNGQSVALAAAQLQTGEIVLLKPGSVVPADGVMIEAQVLVDESMLTGEALPILKKRGEALQAGTLVQTGSGQMIATRVGAMTTLQHIIRLTREAQGRKAPIQRLADQVAGVFVPLVLGIALLTFMVWYIWGPVPQLHFAFLTAVSVLIISCPCALGLATPTAVMVGTGRAAKKGLMFKGGDVLERLHQVNTIVVDKTGTLTEGKPQVTQILTMNGHQENDILKYAAALEARSEHILAQAILNEAQARNLDLQPILDFHYEIGQGIEARVAGKHVRVGTVAWLASFTSENHPSSLATHAGTEIGVQVDGQWFGKIYIQDPIRPDAAQTIQALQNAGVAVIMASGDRHEAVQAVAEKVGISTWYAAQKPQDKAALVSRLQAEGKIVGMVGDGINDAPALALADVGMAVGNGTDIAVQTAGLTLLRPDLNAIWEAIQISRQTLAVIRQNLFFAFIYNIIGIPLAAGLFFPFFGWLLNPMLGSAAMALSSVSVVSNSLRVAKKRI